MEQTAMTAQVNRTYKDSLFRKIFGEKDKLLSLYNAVNGTSYDDSQEISINTLEDAVYINVKNDISFILDFQLSLYEHQSTDCANMPLRDLQYVAKLLQGVVGERSVYSSKKILLPTPMFVVFYNGKKEKPERWIEKLSDAFEKPTDNPKLELEVLILNVNYGKNKELMEQCRSLEEYAIYVARVRKYAEFMEIEDAVERAVVECIDEGVLADFLTKHRAEAIRMSLLEYNEERDLRLMRQDEREIGKEIGKAEGKVETIVSIIRKNFPKGKTTMQMADILDLDLDMVEQVVRIIKEFPELSDSDVAGRLL